MVAHAALLVEQESEATVVSEWEWEWEWEAMEFIMQADTEPIHTVVIMELDLLQAEDQRLWSVALRKIQITCRFRQHLLWIRRLQ
jgi:hypothetical protein